MSEVLQQFPKTDGLTQRSDGNLPRQDVLDFCFSKGIPHCEILRTLLNDPEFAVLALDYIAKQHIGKQHEQKQIHVLNKCQGHNSSRSSSPRNAWSGRKQESGVPNERWMIVIFLLTAFGLYHLYKLVSCPNQNSTDARLKKEAETKVNAKCNQTNRKDDNDRDNKINFPTRAESCKNPVEAIFNVNKSFVDKEGHESDKGHEKEENAAKDSDNENLSSLVVNDKCPTQVLDFNDSLHQEPHNQSISSCFESTQESSNIVTKMSMVDTVWDDDYLASMPILDFSQPKPFHPRSICSTEKVSTSAQETPISMEDTEDMEDTTQLSDSDVSGTRTIFSIEEASTSALTISSSTEDTEDMEDTTQFSVSDVSGTHTIFSIEEASTSALTISSSTEDTDDIEDTTQFSDSDVIGTHTRLENRNKRRKLNPKSTDCCDSNPNGDNLFTQSHEVLQQYFGYSSFQPGQYDVIQALMKDKRDAALFLPYNHAEALCYQIPALLSSGTNADRNNIVVVATPRNSFEDHRIDKLNALTLSNDINRNRQLATCLEPGYQNKYIERGALHGCYNIIYATPKKVSGKFMDELLLLHANPNNPKRIALVVFDYGVLEGSYDFRPMYERIGSKLRENDKQGRNEIPILALIRGYRYAPMTQRMARSYPLHSIHLRDDALRVYDKL